ncbi:MAG: hypothetical protein ACLTV6_02740 [Christensenellales bacterium]
MGVFSEQQALYAVVMVCLTLVLMMVITLILMYRRSAAAEKQAEGNGSDRSGKAFADK